MNSPSVLKVIRTSKCNFRCRFCLQDCFGHPHGEDEEASFSQEALEHAMQYARRELGINEINFTGGEPLATRPNDLPREISLGRLQGFSQVTLLTNGSLLSREIIDLLCDAGLTHLSVSLHTGDVSVYAFLTSRGKGEAAAVHEHVKSMITYASRKPDLITRLNAVRVLGYSESIPEILLFAEHLGARECTLSEMLPVNDFCRLHHEPLPLDHPDLVRIDEREWGLTLFRKKGGSPGLSVGFCRFAGFPGAQTKDLYFLPSGTLTINPAHLPEGAEYLVKAGTPA